MSAAASADTSTSSVAVGSNGRLLETVDLRAYGFTEHAMPRGYRSRPLRGSAGACLAAP